MIAMTFSSMPVRREDILNSAIKIVEKCKTHPRVIALIGNHISEVIPHSLKTKLDKLVAQGKLLEGRGAPFGLLFGKLDALCVHGGLGTTAEALRAGIPTTVVGVLLMDQRFWGEKVKQLGVGDTMCHIKSFPSKCVSIVDNMLEEGSKFKVKAKEIATQIQPTSADGVPENVKAISMALAQARPVNTSKTNQRLSVGSFLSPEDQDAVPVNAVDELVVEVDTSVEDALEKEKLEKEKEEEEKKRLEEEEEKKTKEEEERKRKEEEAAQQKAKEAQEAADKAKLEEEEAELKRQEEEAARKQKEEEEQAAAAVVVQVEPEGDPVDPVDPVEEGEKTEEPVVEEDSPAVEEQEVVVAAPTEEEATA